MATGDDKNFMLEDIENVNLDNRRYSSIRKRDDLKAMSPGIEIGIKSRRASASDRKRAPFIDVCELLKMVTHISSAAMILANSSSLTEFERDRCQLGEDISSLIGTLEDQNEALSKAAEGIQPASIGSDIKETVESVNQVIEALMKIVTEAATVKSLSDDTMTKSELREVSFRDSELEHWRCHSNTIGRQRKDMARSLGLPGVKCDRFTTNIQNSIPLESIERQVHKQSILTFQKGETASEIVKQKTELEFEGEQLKLQFSFLENLIPKLAEEVESSQKEVSKLKSEIASAERDRDNVMANLHWRAQTRVDMQCNLMELQMEISQVDMEVSKLTDETSVIQDDIARKMQAAEKLRVEQQLKLKQFERLVSSREEELTTAKRREAAIRIDLIQKEQELSLLSEKIEQLRSEEVHFDQAKRLEDEIKQKQLILHDLNKGLLEKEARDSIFKIRADFIDEQLRNSKDGSTIVSLQSPDFISILGQIYKKMEALEAKVQMQNSNEDDFEALPDPPVETRERQDSIPIEASPAIVAWPFNSESVPPTISEEASPINQRKSKRTRAFRERTPDSRMDRTNSAFAKASIPLVLIHDNSYIEKSRSIEDSSEEDNIVTFRDHSEESAFESGKVKETKPNANNIEQETLKRVIDGLNDQLKLLLASVAENEVNFVRILVQVLEKSKINQELKKSLMDFLLRKVTTRKTIDTLQVSDNIELKDMLLKIFEEDAGSTKSMLDSVIQAFNFKKP